MRREVLATSASPALQIGEGVFFTDVDRLDMIGGDVAKSAPTRVLSLFLIVIFRFAVSMAGTAR